MSKPDLEPQPTPQKKLFDFLKAFLIPTLIGKSCVIFFGLKYTEAPGEGYGIGLIISILYTLTTLGRFIWKYRNYEDL